MVDTPSQDATSQGTGSKPLGQVLCFASAKGGTGKTILSASLAYLLLKSGLRVVAIDADFSTRGLSLYLLGDVLANQSLVILEENCLADSILNDRPPTEISPLIITRDSIRYPVVLSNKDVRRGGVPDERFLGGLPSRADATVTSPDRYYRYLQKLCDRFRHEYDYVIIDTRGGYDFTSAAPATIADGFYTVLEADRISLEQVRGFLAKIDQFADSVEEMETQKVRAVHKGFLVNKAIHSVDDKLFPAELFRLYEATTFGAIPSDRDAIRAYQVKQIPAEKSPDSDFAYFSSEALEKLLAPQANWHDADNIQRFRKFFSRIRDRYEARKRVESLQQYIPSLLLILVVVAAFSYLLFRNQTWPYSLPIFYAALALFVMASICGSMLSTLALLRNREASSKMLVGVATTMLITFLGLGYLAVFDVRKTFSSKVLIQRAADDLKTITSQREELNKLSSAKSELESQVSRLSAEKQRADEAQAQLDQSRQSLANANSAQARAEEAYRNAQDQIANLKEQVTSLQQTAHVGNINPATLKQLSVVNDNVLQKLKKDDCRGVLDSVFGSRLQRNLIGSTE